MSPIFAPHPQSILLLGTQMAIGGAQRLQLDQAQWLHARGYRVQVVFFYDRDGLHDRWQMESEFPVYDLHAFTPAASLPQKAVKLISGLWRLWRFMRHEQFQAVITYTQDCNTLGIPLAWLAGIPVRVGTYLGSIRGMPLWRKRLHAQIVNIGWMNRIIAASTGSQRNALDDGIHPERMVVIPNGIRPFTLEPSRREAIRRRLELKDNDVFVLAVGRLVYEKGHEFLVQAMQNVHGKNPNVLVGICGTGPLHDSLQSQIADAGLKDSVRLLGACDDVRDLLAAADLFVLPSRWEGLPMALLEAMMAGLPVVATRVEGVEEVVQQGVHGLLVPLEDANAMSVAIQDLAVDPERRRSMGAKGSIRVREAYTTDHMCRGYLKIVEDLYSSKLGIGGKS